MTTNETREVLAENLRKIIIHKGHVKKATGEANANEFARAIDNSPNQTTIARILKCTMAASVDTLDELSTKLGLSAYQLLVADLDPATARKPIPRARKSSDASVNQNAGGGGRR